jgi:hypothetical protein
LSSEEVCSKSKIGNSKDHLRPSTSHRAVLTDKLGITIARFRVFAMHTGNISSSAVATIQSVIMKKMRYQCIIQECIVTYGSELEHGFPGYEAMADEASMIKAIAEEMNFILECCR